MTIPRVSVQAVIIACLGAFLLAQEDAAPPISVLVDATNAPRKIFHAQLRIPANPGTLTLYYPKWIPGEHGPTGPIENLTGLQFSAGGQSLAWRRDLRDGWTLHVQVPPGQNQVTADLDFVSPAELEDHHTAGASATEKLAILNWNTVLLYPEGRRSDDLTYTASLRIPEGWQFGTSLLITSTTSNEIHFAPISLTLLVDSPVIMGQYLKVVPLNPGKTPPVEMNIAADSAAALEPPQQVWEHYRDLVSQAKTLFGAHHYLDYHFILTLSDHVDHFGLEHHESNDSRLGERGLVDSDSRMLGAGLLPHEYVHSWNGKYRRPADLTAPDYQQTLQTDLLWVYEGLTSYLGQVLATRSGLRTPDQFRDELAMIAADLDHRSGRVWRSLQDTADGVPAMQGAPAAWTSWRRPLDYYDEDVLNWLWADVIIRQQTRGRKSLDDFCKLFHGAPSGPAVVKTYNFDDIVNTLNQIFPYDWRAFWTERLTNHGPGAPLGGVEGSGWKLVYDAERSPIVRASEEYGKQIDASHSLGLLLRSDGGIVDTVESMIAAKAGIGPGMKIIAVNGRRFSQGVWRDALKNGKNTKDLLELIVENTEYCRTFKLDYHDGEKYAHLVRDQSKPDLLTEIVKPH